MAVKIRLKRMGSKKKPFYRIIAADSRSARDGRFIETLGYYNPMKEPPDIKLEEEALFKWMERGAIPSPNTESLLRKVGFMQKWQLFKQGVKREDIDAKVGEQKSTPAPPPAAAKEPGPVKKESEPAEIPPAEETGEKHEAVSGEAEVTGAYEDRADGIDAVREGIETGDGEHIEGNTTLEITWTVIPLFIVLGFAYLGAALVFEGRIAGEMEVHDQR